MKVRVVHSASALINAAYQTEETQFCRDILRIERSSITIYPFMLSYVRSLRTVMYRCSMDVDVSWKLWNCHPFSFPSASF